jgi:excisionase family DNA binding protein
MTLRTAEEPAGLMTIEEVARYLRLSRAKTYQLAAVGTIPTIRLGRSVRVPRRRLDEWLAAQSG